MKKHYSSVRQVNKHEASKKGHKHIHGAGFITRWTAKSKDGDLTVTRYKHRPNWNAEVPTQHNRVVEARLVRDPKYLDDPRLNRWTRQNLHFMVVD